MPLSVDGAACRLARVIEAVHAALPWPAPPATPKNRYVVVEPVGGRGYVQCLFQDHDSWMLCEVASGWWDKGRPYLSTAQRLRAAVNGFDTAPPFKGNYQKVEITPDATSRARVAWMMWSTLTQVYGAPAVRMEVLAPEAADQLPAVMTEPCEG